MKCLPHLWLSFEFVWRPEATALTRLRASPPIAAYLLLCLTEKRPVRTAATSCLNFSHLEGNGSSRWGGKTLEMSLLQSGKLLQTLPQGNLTALISDTSSLHPTLRNIKSILLCLPLFWRRQMWKGSTHQLLSCVSRQLKLQLHLIESAVVQFWMVLCPCVCPLSLRESYV